ncbi:MAG TPA: hypothetical protein VGP07_20180 [Polyangia bacterium]|jgi:hypothetical protein
MPKVLLRKELKATLLAASFMAAIIMTASTLADGCGKVDEIFDCDQVCSRYRDCFDSGYDVDGCRSRCRTNSDNNPSIRSDADQCEACIDDKSCASGAFNCATSCGTIVP